MLRNFVIVSAHKTCRSARENDIASIAAGFQQETILVERGDMGFLKMVDRPGVKEHCLGSRRVLSQAPKASDWSLIDGSYIQFK